MKLRKPAYRLHRLSSPPARRRGLKRDDRMITDVTVKVASRAEAWIETFVLYPYSVATSVASRAEAWIETWHGM